MSAIHAKRTQHQPFSFTQFILSGQVMDSKRGTDNDDNCLGMAFSYTNTKHATCLLKNKQKRNPVDAMNSAKFHPKYRQTNI